MVSFVGKYSNLQKSFWTLFALALTVLEKVTFTIFDHQKGGQGHGIFEVTPFDGKF